MNLDSLLPNLGEWLRGTGPEADVVVSTRIRLARNLAHYPFTSRAALAQKAESETKLREAVAKADLTEPLTYVGVANLSTLDRLFLVERQLISRELSSVLEGPRGVAFDSRESVSVMINEEDHLRLQVMRSGLALDEAWAEIDKLDDAIEARIPYAFHQQFGYLTACPTNVGTGMRASVMLHLPALGITRQIEKVFKALQKINLVVRGLYGEGSRASGDLYQISNQVTLGRNEQRLLTEIREVITMIMQYERQARQVLLRERKQAEQDRIARSLGTLASATMITSEETMELLSAVRLGVHLNLPPAEDLQPTMVNQLFIQTQAAHLQKLMGAPLDGEERNAARARYLRTKLRELGNNSR
jgi:protein arginine kinase